VQQLDQGAGLQQRQPRHPAECRVRRHPGADPPQPHQVGDPSPRPNVDALRPWTQRDQAVLDQRTGFIKLAIRHHVPIVPVASIGGSDTVIMLTEGRRLAKALRLDTLLRTKAMPVAAGVPFGLAPGVIPQIPLPAKIRTRFLDPIELGDDPALADDEDYVQTKYNEVVAALQSAMNDLAEDRSFPLLG